jgi:hypothetical protein
LPLIASAPAIGSATPCAAQSAPPEVIAVKLNQVKGVKEDVSISTAIAQPVKARHAIIVASHRLTVDQTRHRFERERGADDQWKPAGPVMPVASEQPHARSIAAHQHAKPVMLDFVQPPLPSRRLGSGAWPTGFAEVGEGYTTRQHDRKIAAFPRGSSISPVAILGTMMAARMTSAGRFSPLAHLGIIELAI